jgi:hypothetical protein
MYFVSFSSVLRLLVTADVPSLLILVTLTMEVMHSSETPIVIGATWRNIPEDSILLILMLTLSSVDRVCL